MLSHHKERKGFHGFGDSEQDAQAMCEQILVQLTTLHHNHRNDRSVALETKVWVSKVIRQLASVFHDYAYSGLEPNREMLGLYDAIQVERDYLRMAELTNQLLRLMCEYVFEERSIKTSLYYRYHPVFRVASH